MQICFPVADNKGIESIVFGHFGSAPVFILYDTETRSIETVNNQDLGHNHGMCSPLKALDGKKVNAIVVGGIGAGAISKLNGMGVKVYKAVPGTVQDNIVSFENNTMAEMTIEHACGGHSGGCAHE